MTWSKSLLAVCLALSFSTLLFPSMASCQALPTVVASVTLEGLTGPVPPTVFFTPITKHMFRVSTYVVITGGTGLCEGSEIADIYANIDYNNGVGSEKSVGNDLQLYFGSNVGQYVETTHNLVAAAGQPISYEFDISYNDDPSCLTGLQYNAYFVLERLTKNLP